METTYQLNWRDLLEGQESGNPFARVAIRALMMVHIYLMPDKTFSQVLEAVDGGCRNRFLTSFNPADLAWLKEQITQLRNEMGNLSQGVQDLQNQDATIAQGVADVQELIQTLAQNTADAETRLQDSINQLQNVGGSGDPAAIAAVVTDLKGQLNNLTAMKVALQSAADAQTQIDQPAQTQSVVLAISPASLNVTRGTPFQFTTNIAGSTFVCQSGTVDAASGVYNAPTDVSITSDSVTATSPDGKQTSAASISITG